MVNRRNNRVLGFTLIELMIVVAIVAIIAAIALPSYNNQVRDSRRADAGAVLMQARQQMERHYSKNYTYAGATAAVGGTISNQSPIDGTFASRHYTISLGDLGGATFTITATPANGQVGDKCGNLTIDQAGTKGHGGATFNECWR